MRPTAAARALSDPRNHQRIKQDKRQLVLDRTTERRLRQMQREMDALNGSRNTEGDHGLR